MYSQRGPAYSNMISINFSIPWQSIAAIGRTASSQQSSRCIDQLQAQREEAMREHVAEVRSWLIAMAKHSRPPSALRSSSSSRLSAERTRAALAAYRGGMARLSAVLEARRMEIDMRLERIRLEMDIARRLGAAEVPDSGARRTRLK